MTRNFTVPDSEEWAETIITYMEANGFPYDRRKQSLYSYLASCASSLTGQNYTIFNQSVPALVIDLAAYFSGLSLTTKNSNFNDALAIVNSLLPGRMTVLGTLYSKTLWADLSDFTQNGSSASVVSGAIRLAYGGAVSFDQSLQLNAPITADENVDFITTFKCIALGTNFGISIGRKSIRANGDSSISAHLGDLGVNPNTLNLWPLAGGAFSSPTASNHVVGAVLAVNDVFTLKYSQRGNVCTMIYQNLTSGASGALSLTSNMNAVSPNFILPAVDKFCINIIGGTYDLAAVSLISNQKMRPFLMPIGDSKTQGYSALSLGARWGSLIAPSFPSVEVFGGAGDATASVMAEVPYIVSLSPRNVLLNVGRNDLFYGIGSGTWQANYASIVSQLRAAGINVVHLMPIPETIQDQSALTAYINTAFPGDNKIDVSGSWVSVTDLSSDGIHPTPAGNIKIANAVVANASMFV